MVSRVFSALCLVGCVVSCSDPVSPPVPDGLFVLERVSGVAVPVVVYADDVFRYITVAETLTVRSDGVGEQASVQRVERRDGTGSPNIIAWRVPIELRSTRSGLQFVRGCPINAACQPSAPVEVSRTADGLSFSVGAERRQYRAAAQE